MRPQRLRLHDETENIDWNSTVEFEEYHLLCPQSYHLLLILNSLNTVCKMYLNLYNSHVIKKGIDKLFLKGNLVLDGPKLKYSSIKAKNHKTFFIDTLFNENKISPN